MNFEPKNRREFTLSGAQRKATGEPPCTKVVLADIVHPNIGNAKSKLSAKPATLRIVPLAERAVQRLAEVMARRDMFETKKLIEAHEECARYCDTQGDTEAGNYHRMHARIWTCKLEEQTSST